jgi:hypothetical protein
MPVRPTLRCLRDDLRMPTPPARVPLDSIDHPLLNKARARFTDTATPHERIRSIDCVVLFKVKAGRWRGAVFEDAPAAEVRDWLVAAGVREDGSSDDFYASLHSSAQASRQRYNTEHDRPLTTDTHVGHLLPGQDDLDRHLLEAGTRFALDLDAALRRLLREALHDGHEHAADMTGFRLGVIVRADEGNETYVAIRITGSVPQDLTALILDRVPGCARDAWFPEYSLPERSLLPAEQAWSNIMDPKAAVELLDSDTK